LFRRKNLGVWNNDCHEAFDKNNKVFAKLGIDNALYTMKTLDPIFNNDKNNHGMHVGSA
jgi:hypothetical protein